MRFYAVLDQDLNVECTPHRFTRCLSGFPWYAAVARGYTERSDWRCLVFRGDFGGPSSAAVDGDAAGEERIGSHRRRSHPPGTGHATKLDRPGIPVADRRGNPRQRPRRPPLGRVHLDTHQPAHPRVRCPARQRWLGPGGREGGSGPGGRPGHRRRRRSRPNLDTAVRPMSLTDPPGRSAARPAAKADASQYQLGPVDHRST